MRKLLKKVWAWICEDTQERVIWTALQAAAGIAAAVKFDNESIGVAVAAVVAWIKAEAKKRLAKRRLDKRRKGM